MGNWLGSWLGDWLGSGEAAPAGSISGTASVAIAATGAIFATGELSGYAVLQIAAAGVITDGAQEVAINPALSGGSPILRRFIGVTIPRRTIPVIRRPVDEEAAFLLLL